jgi:hypothetical protein
VERAELGSWLNTLYPLQGNSVVSLFGRAAWAHDWQNTPQASATFLGLSPIAAFIVNGAKPRRIWEWSPPAPSYAWRAAGP